MDLALLSVTEQIRLSQMEERIERGVKTSLEMAQALVIIREERLYRLQYGTFEAYCQTRWGFGDRYARLLIRFAETVERLQIGTIDPTERQVRPIAQLPESQQQEAWEAAKMITSENPTHNHTSRAAAAVKAKPKTFGVGQQVTVLDETSLHYGKSVTVTDLEGVIVQCEVEGKMVPFLSNEVGDAAPKPEKARSQQPKSKRSPIEGLFLELEIERMRVELLEQELTRLIEAIERSKLITLDQLRELAGKIRQDCGLTV